MNILVLNTIKFVKIYFYTIIKIINKKLKDNILVIYQLCNKLYHVQNHLSNTNNKDNKNPYFNTIKKYI